uniref:Uncharacterized protein n=1 Tax=Micrurus surinamensis TaxID=129470 RepID=A0A2D4PVY1_MICSU
MNGFPREWGPAVGKEKEGAVLPLRLHLQCHCPPAGAQGKADGFLYVSHKKQMLHMMDQGLQSNKIRGKLRIKRWGQISLINGSYNLSYIQAIQDQIKRF